MDDNILKTGYIELFFLFKLYFRICIIKIVYLKYNIAAFPVLIRQIYSRYIFIILQNYATRRFTRNTQVDYIIKAMGKI